MQETTRDGLISANRLELWAWIAVGRYFVISTPVILNGGQIYTFALFKRGQRVRVCVRGNKESAGTWCPHSLWGFFGIKSKHYLFLVGRVCCPGRVCMHRECCE